MSKEMNKYQRKIKGVVVDLYDIFDAYEVTDQAVGHAIKKLIMAGQRGYKSEMEDLHEALVSVQRGIDIRNRTVIELLKGSTKK
jgi:hypothetical protein